MVKAPKLSVSQQYGAALFPQLLLWLTVVVVGFSGFTGLLASAAGAAKALLARRAATARMLVNCILVGLMVLKRRRMNWMIVKRFDVKDEWLLNAEWLVAGDE